MFAETDPIKDDWRLLKCLPLWGKNGQFTVFYVIAMYCKNMIDNRLLSMNNSAYSLIMSNFLKNFSHLLVFRKTP